MCQWMRCDGGDRSLILIKNRRELHIIFAALNLIGSKSESKGKD